MKRLRVYIINIVGFNKTEANATIILLIIVLLAGIVPRKYLRMSHSPISTVQEDQQMLSEWLLEMDKNLKEKATPQKQQQTVPEFNPFQFDPNLASNAELERLGFQSYVAQRIVNYRKAGGSFKTPEDLKRIFGIDSMLVNKLISFISITVPPTKAIESTNPPVSTEKSEPTKEIAKVWMDLNTATREELQEISGIGPFYAKNILEYRQKLGGYHAHEQLSEVYRMKPDILNLLKSHTYIHAAPVRNLPINSDSLKHLARHPYLSWNQAKAIINYRKQHGSFTKAEELLNIKIIDDSLYQKISPYISVEP